MGVNVSNLDETTLQRFNDAKSDMNKNNELLGDYNMTLSEKLEKAESVIDRFDETKCHIVNLNEDPMLSRKMKYPLDKD